MTPSSRATVTVDARRYPGSYVALIAAALLAGTPFVSARAQIESGRVVDDSTHAALAHVPVSLEEATDGKWKLVDTTTTDRKGMFQFVLPRPGVYRLGFADWLAPVYHGAADTLVADSMRQREFALPIVRTRGSRPYFWFEVDKPAAPTQASPAPEYPPELRSNGVDGAVLAQWVVTADGRADMSTFHVITATDSAFAETVRRNLPRMKFYPASIAGTRVPQLVEQAMYFNSGHR